MIPIAESVNEDENTENIEMAELIELSPKMLQSINYSKIINSLIWLDLLFSILYALYNEYFIISIMFLLIGIHGVNDYNKKSMRIFVPFLIIINIIRIFTFVINYSKITKSNRNNFYALQIIMTIIEGWIFLLMCKLIKSMKELTEEELEVIRIWKKNSISL